jgi:two-component system sensor histidine kinase SenX3
VVDEARANPAHRQTKIETHIPDALPPLLGDCAALGSAVHNLLDNAVKYSPGADAVWCEAEVSDDGLTIRVRDHGVGMSEDDRRHAFERFRRGRGPITEQVKGTGLGLSLVDHIVRAHGGRIECDSRLGAGTTISIHFSAPPADTRA